MNILLLGSQHGNELLGDKLYLYIQRHRPDLKDIVTFKIGNPLAKKRGVRYIESDMNRSYVVEHSQHYEEHLAKKLLHDIHQSDYSLVLDLHTCSVDQPPSIIAAALTPSNLPFIDATHINQVVLMKPSIAEHSLIGNVHQAVSIEVYEQIPESFFERLCDDIERYARAEVHQLRKHFYKVTGFIEKNEEVKDFIPFLFGEAGYKTTNYNGFKLEAIQQPKLQ